MGAEYETIIGLEVHVELLTKSKLFCRCSADFGAPPNTQVCPVCLGLPGVLPVVNRKAIELLVRSALPLNCRITAFSKFDRKNYFYPDMPKNYQISQYDLPLAVNGYVTISIDGKSLKIGIKRIHIEEDTGKSTHMGTIDRSLYTLEDYNRAGVPLLEIVTEPDIRSAEEAQQFLQTLRNLLRWLEISDCKMEEGSLRCDANISIRKRNEALGTKTEIKNMNSFKSVKEALEYEEERQRELVAQGQKIIQETRGWDEKKSITIAMRSKEAEHDYRYFPEPDLPPLQISTAWIEEIRASLPELPSERKERFMREFGLPAYDAEFLTSSKELADFFEETCRCIPSPKAISNWLMGDISKFLNERVLSIGEARITPGDLAAMIRFLEDGTISGKIGKSLIEEMLQTGERPDALIKKHGWFQISDEVELLKIVKGILSENPRAVEEYRGGSKKTLGFLVGQVMKSTGGKANPGMINALLLQEIEGKAPSQEK